MTLSLLTKSHGIIECGFCGAFMKLSRIGEYCFETKDLCALAENLAENLELKEAKIFGYPLDKFWQLEGRYTPQFVADRVNSFLNGNSGVSEFVRESRELSAEERLELMNDKIPVDVTVSEGKKSVNVGEYEIENAHFLFMAYYLINGGISGWAGDIPGFAKSAKKAIESSKNPFYKH